MPAKDACSAQPDARGNLIRRDLHSTLVRSRATERHKASRSLRWSVFRGRLTATHPCRETHRGSVGTPTLTDCLWPVMDSQANDVLSLNNLRALLPSLLTRFARSLRKGTPLNRQLRDDPYAVSQRIRLLTNVVGQQSWLVLGVGASCPECRRIDGTTSSLVQRVLGERFLFPE